MLVNLSKNDFKKKGKLPPLKLKSECLVRLEKLPWHWLPARQGPRREARGLGEGRPPWHLVAGKAQTGMHIDKLQTST